MCCQSHIFILATALGWNRQKISHITAPQKYVVGKKSSASLFAFSVGLCTPQRYQRHFLPQVTSKVLSETSMCVK